MVKMLQRSDLLVTLLVFYVCLNGGGCHQVQGWNQLAGTRWLSRQAERWWDLYVPSRVNKSSPCFEAMITMLDSVTLNQTWALKMVDSWGKAGDGGYYGPKTFLGVFDECVNTKSPNDIIHPQYCTVTLQQILLKNSLQEESPHIWLPIKQQNLGVAPFFINTNNYNGSYIIYGTCLPDACTAEELQDSLDKVYSPKNYDVVSVFCQPNAEWSAVTAGDIAFIILVSVLFFLILLAGAIDMYIEKTNNITLAKGGVRYLLPFSVYTNASKLFHVNTKPAPGTISSLHGIKVLSMTWVIYGHQQLANIPYSANLMGLWPKLNGFLSQVLFNAYPSVDTFFFIGGLLLCSSLLRQLKNTKRFNIVLFYVHRLIRLIPSIGLICGLYATVVHLFVSGPLAYNYQYWRKGCQQFWWRDILFVNNFVNDGTNEAAGDCLGQSWYLAVDTQLYLVAPLIILPLFYFRGAGKVWLYLLSLSSILIPAMIIYANDFPPTNLVMAPKGEEFMNQVYLVPWCRAGPWLVGIWLGYIMYTQGNKKVVLKQWQVAVGWTVASLTGFLVVFGMWSYNQVPPPRYYDVMTQVVYGGFQRFAWGSAVAWVVYACHNGAGGLVNDFLSHPVWQPLSRLTYTIYLVIFPMQFMLTYNTRVLFYYTHLNKIVEVVGALVIAGIISVLVSLTVESPIIGLERLLLQRPDRESPASKAPEDLLQLSGKENPAFRPEITDSSGVNGTTSLETVKTEYITKF
ncbi:nose resistant to fluoxetine protein 6-like [Homarus americanus]|nr:nose resistant to fluoxetine protein 6-like [Homarus americanus]XP_042213224.1 nose resistant to fluoxetine protein 6-like [Homarus americanus]